MRKNSRFPVKYEKETRESQISSFGGAPIFLEFLKSIGFDKLVSSNFETVGNQGFHPFHNVLTLVLLNILGGESVSDVTMLENDSGLKRILRKCEHTFKGFSGREFRRSKKGFFPSATTLRTFLNGFKSDSEDTEREATPKGSCTILPVDEKLNHLTAINRDLIAIAQRLAKQETATLDMDNNIIPSYKRNAKVSYKKEKSYQPFNVYWHEQDLMIHSEFRDGNVPAGFEQLRILKEAGQQLPATVKRVQVRSDSAGYQHKFLEYMESSKGRFGRVEFAVSCDVTKAFREAVLDAPEEQWKKVVYRDSYGNIIETNQEVAEICFVPATRQTYKKNAPSYRYLATREATDTQLEFSDTGQMTFKTSSIAEEKLHLEVFNNVAYKIFGIVTNKSESPLEILLWHRKRCGKSEQEHARLTNDMAGGRFPSGDFGPNAAWWQFAIISLNLLKIFQAQTLPPALKGSRIKTLNRHLFHVAIRVVKSSKGMIVKSSKESSHFSIIQFVKRRILKIERALKDSRIWCENATLIH